VCLAHPLQLSIDNWQVYYPLKRLSTNIFFIFLAGPNELTIHGNRECQQVKQLIFEQAAEQFAKIGNY